MLICLHSCYRTQYVTYDEVSPHICGVLSMDLVMQCSRLLYVSLHAVSTELKASNANKLMRRKLQPKTQLPPVYDMLAD